MTGSADLAAHYRAQAEALDKIAALEERQRDAKEAYRAAPDDEAAKVAHREASQVLAVAREDLRAQGVVTDPSATIAAPQSVSASTNSPKEA